MTTNVHKTALLGELVVAAFDGAARYSTHPEDHRDAAATVMHLLLRTSRATTPRQWTEGKTSWLILA